MTLTNSTCHPEFGGFAEVGTEDVGDLPARLKGGLPCPPTLLRVRVARSNGLNRENRLMLQPLIIPATVPCERINHSGSLSDKEPGVNPSYCWSDGWLCTRMVPCRAAHLILENPSR